MEVLNEQNCFCWIKMPTLTVDRILVVLNATVVGNGTSDSRQDFGGCESCGCQLRQLTESKS